MKNLQLFIHRHYESIKLILLMIVAALVTFIIINQPQPSTPRPEPQQPTQPSNPQPGPLQRLIELPFNLIDRVI